MIVFIRPNQTLLQAFLIDFEAHNNSKELQSYFVGFFQDHFSYCLRMKRYSAFYSVFSRMLFARFKGMEEDNLNVVDLYTKKVFDVSWNLFCLNLACHPQILARSLGCCQPPGIDPCKIFAGLSLE